MRNNNVEKNGIKDAKTKKKMETHRTYYCQEKNIKRKK